VPPREVRFSLVGHDADVVCVRRPGTRRAEASGRSRRAARRERSAALVGDSTSPTRSCRRGAHGRWRGQCDAIAQRLSTLPQVPGRLERIYERPTVLRDYAHTPDALERALLAVRPFATRRLIAVFGCGGDRDRGKRPQMGAIAERLADHTIVTSDNPRTEDPDRIIDDIEAGMHGANHERITDRMTPSRAR
jgi:UDP-N-acetylmuramoyl-L-alanyl-D-glutamate--2,6-diaminopimelate ligase